MEDIKAKYKTVMDDHFPDTIKIDFGGQVLVYKKRTWKLPDGKGDLVEKGLRYGENPGQEAALYELINGNLVLGDCRFIEPGKGMVSAISETHMLQAGKHPGKTNLTDVDNALNVIRFLGGSATAVIVKHNNPCGVASKASLALAYSYANQADRIAAFGGAAVFNMPVDRPTAELISQNYLEVVAAPDFEEGTVDVLKSAKNLRIIQVPRFDQLASFRGARFVDFKSLVDGGIIVQQSPINVIREAGDLKIAECVHKGVIYRIDREPKDWEIGDMIFGWAVEQGVSSNSVIFVKDECTVGIGTGEQDRVGVAEIAVFKAYQKFKDALCFERHGIPYKGLEFKIKTDSSFRDRGIEYKDDIDLETQIANAGLRRSTMVSDAFFPFRDGVDVGLKEGVSAVVHPGGSDRDFESIQACNEAGATMMFTGQRAFKH